MVFKLNFEQFEILSRRIDSLEGASKDVVIFPIFFYEGNHELFLYKLFQGFIFCTIVDKSTINVDQFKTRYLDKAYELTENYLPTYEKAKPNIVPQENPNA